MAHPKKFEDDDPTLARVRELALALPGAKEKISHGRPAFYTTKIFTYYGGAVKTEGEWEQHPSAVMLLLDDDETAAIRQDERGWVPAYLGPSGWTGLDLGPDTDWDEVAELMEMSFRRTAGKRLIAELDRRG